MPRIEPTYLDQQFSKAAEKIGLTVVSTPQGRNSVSRDGRPSCCGNSTCIPICPIGAKYDGSVHAGKAETAGAVIYDQAIAYKVNVDAEGKISGIAFKFSDGSEATAIGKIYVLAAHAIETPKLLLISRTDALPNGVANSSDQVGRNLMDHPTQLSWALANEPVYPFRGPMATSGIEMLRDGEFRKQRSAFRIEIGNDGWSWPFGWPPSSAPGLIDQGLRGRALQEHLNVIASQQIRLASLTEQLPDPNNRIVPAWGNVDALGIPQPRITYSVPQYALNGMAEAIKVHNQLFDALGVSFRQHRAEYEGAGHIMGTYRMGADPKTSVVDAECRSHDHPNLFMLGSGVFPSTGTSNPTLTIAALALRAAEAVKSDLQKQ
jgi:choline dehydrogenase-like flavoprotein